MRFANLTLALLTACGILACPPSPLRAALCPFCSAVAQTFTEEMDSMDAAVIAKLVKLPARNDDLATEIAKARFEVVEVIKGGSLVGSGDRIDTLFLGEGKPGDLFLIMGADASNLAWASPLRVNEAVRDYLRTLPKLPKEGADRLAFFQNFLEDTEEVLARDAYDEFAKAPYGDVKDLKARMDHDKLVSWIRNPDIPASRRRLYFVMLGVCGTDADLPMLEEMLKSDDRKMKSGLDSMIACYLTLKGAEGMPLVEELFLKNADAEYADTYAAIMAIRFHGTEAEIISKPRLLVGLRHMLERPKLADLVIPDLARWEDWSQLDRLVDLFKNADEKANWVRVPVVNYLRACPLPEAKAAIQELEKIDPAAVKRANTFFPPMPKKGK